MNDLISVIVPVYKVEEWLDQCVESIVNQSYKNLEIILVDDGSPDNCPQMCDEWAKNDERIKVIHKENGGLSTARNAGLDICSGEYISFIDSDDYIHKDMYINMLEDLKRTDSDIVKCGRYIDSDGKISENRVLDSEKEYNHDEILDCFFYHKDDFCSGVWDKLYKAELFKGIRFPDGLNSEDYYIYGVIYNRANKLYYNNKYYYYYRIREDSICRKEGITDHSFDKIIVSDKVYEYVVNNYPDREEDAQIFQSISRFAIYQEVYQKNHKKKLEKEWKKSLKEKKKVVLHNQKIGKLYKFKYCMMCAIPKVYIKLK